MKNEAAENGIPRAVAGIETESETENASKSKGSTSEPSIDELIDNFHIADFEPSKFEEENDQQVPTAKNVCVACSISPISLIIQLSQKARNSPPLIWEEFIRNGLFGCRLQWGNKIWITSAEWTQEGSKKHGGGDGMYRNIRKSLHF